MAKSLNVKITILSNSVNSGDVWVKMFGLFFVLDDVPLATKSCYSI